MSQEENSIVKKNESEINAKVYNPVSKTYNSSANFKKNCSVVDPNKAANDGRLTCDSISQICEHIAGFFTGCPGMITSYGIYNNHGLGWKKDDNGNYIIGKKYCEEGIYYPVFYSEDHISEIRIYIQDLEQASGLSNVIRHHHLVKEEFSMPAPFGAKDEDGNLIEGKDAVGVRNHILNVRVMIINEIDPMDPENGDPNVTEDDNLKSIIAECYGIIPMKWNDMEGYGVADRLSPNGVNEDAEIFPDIPRGAPNENEQEQWEEGFKGIDVDGKPVEVSSEQALKWKWKWLKAALKDNPNIVEMNEIDNDWGFTWRSIECSREPIDFREDGLIMTKFNSILPADIFRQVFSVFERINVSTYVKKQ